MVIYHQTTIHSVLIQELHGYVLTNAQKGVNIFIKQKLTIEYETGVLTVVPMQKGCVNIHPSYIYIQT